MSPPGAVRVALVEDDVRTREALRLLLDGTEGFRCVAAAGSVEGALRSAAAESPEVILLDVDLPGTPGPEGVEKLAARYPGATILMLSVYADEERVFASICNGASGYLLKKTPPARLLEAIREARDGGAPVSPEIARRVLQLCRGAAPRPRPQHDLSPQEVRLLGLLAEGHGYQAAAERLGVTINTVRDYVRSSYEKLHVHTRAAAVSAAMKSGILR
jgi:DNA-binding NarL/FixJ family response regulator